MKFNHIPVLLESCINGLNIKKNGIYVDGTLGGAGHSKKILEVLQGTGLLVGIDRDADALIAAKQSLKNYNNVEYIHDNHDNLKQILKDLNIKKVDGILLDLGISSYQIDEKKRGFSYLGTNDLDMRMDQSQEITAKYIVNTYSEDSLADIIYKYSEEKFARKIAKNICKYRKIKDINTTKELVEIIESSIPGFAKKSGHPAKKTFQAIRIEVNDELSPLSKTVDDCIDCLNPGGRLCIITFHSLEDRIVKKSFVQAQGICTCPKDLPYCVCGCEKKGTIITKKPIVASQEEQQQNSRATSAKLRIFEKE